MSDNIPEIVDDEGSGTDIPCMLLPLLDQTLMVPTVTVAEMGVIKPFTNVNNTPDWFLGFYDWHNMRVPVICLEALNGVASAKFNAKGRIAVLNNTGVSEHMPFIAILTQGIPRMARVEEKDIEEDREKARNNFDVMVVRVESESYSIPDVSAIENAFLQLDIK